LEKLRVGIIGSGKIGTDLLFKTMKSRYLEPVFLVGRNKGSEGLQIAKELGVEASAGGIEFLEENTNLYDCIFDATSAKSHLINNKIFKRYNKTVIDLTPAKLGPFCVPSINLNDCVNQQNVNMITCGGQAAIPMAYALKQVFKSIDYLEVVSSISSDSAGIATRENIDEYLTTTEQSLSFFSGAKKTKAILNINPAKPSVYMQTTLYAYGDFDDLELMVSSVEKMEAIVSSYVPGYKLVIRPTFEKNRITLSVSVKGQGDFLPEYAGNLDIINCAAIMTAEHKFLN